MYQSGLGLCIIFLSNGVKSKRNADDEALALLELRCTHFGFKGSVLFDGLGLFFELHESSRCDFVHLVKASGMILGIYA